MGRSNIASAGGVWAPEADRSMAQGNGTGASLGMEPQGGQQGVWIEVAVTGNWRQHLQR